MHSSISFFGVATMIFFNDLYHSPINGILQEQCGRNNVFSYEKKDLQETVSQTNAMTTAV